MRHLAKGKRLLPANNRPTDRGHTTVTRQAQRRLSTIALISAASMFVLVAVRCAAQQPDADGHGTGRILGPSRDEPMQGVVLPCDE